MTKLTKISRVEAQQIQKDIAKALKPVFEKYGLLLSRESSTFGPAVYHTKLELLVTNELGLPKDAQYEELKRKFPTYAHRKFKHPQFGICVFVGFNSRAPRYPIMFLTPANESYRMDIMSMVSMELIDE